MHPIVLDPRITGAVQRFLVCLLLILILGTSIRQAVPAPVALTENVTAELIPDVAKAAPGDRFSLALRLTIREGWHIYWTNPGDSGLPPVASWQEPDHVSVGPMRFPVPEAIPIGPLMNYGFKDEVILLMPVVLDAALPTDRPLRLAADVEWLVCEEICIPESAGLDIEIPVHAGPPVPAPGVEALFTAARAALPQPAPAAWSPRFALDGDSVLLQVDLPAAVADQNLTLRFFPAEPGVILHNAPQLQQVRAGGLGLQMQADYRARDDDFGPLDGLLVLAGEQETEMTGVPRTGYEISAQRAAPSDLGAVVGAQTARSDTATTGGGGLAPDGGDLFTGDGTGETPPWRIDLSTAFLFALLGGLLLNLMPCVFPVLFLKAAGMVEHAHHHAWQVRLQGLAFTAGVLISFLALAGGLLALQTAGVAVGWGFQLQSPAFVAVMAFLFFAIGLSLTGLFTLGGSFVNFGGRLADRPGLVGSFFTGVLACLVATPCTAPFMGAAIGFAVGQSAPVSLGIFAALGLGMALPYLLVCLAPGVLRSLPRPGPWMERFKQALAFPMYATAVWLVWVLSQQAGPLGVAAVLSGALLIAFVAWIYTITRTGGTVARGLGTGLVLLGLLGLVALAGLTQSVTPPTAQVATAETRDGVSRASGPAWIAFSPERLTALRKEGRPVFLNFTAAWCITCLVNEQVALSSAAVANAFERQGIAYLKGDWTSYDPDITEMLTTFGRSGVPLYLLYPGDGGAPQVLPQILTESRVVEAINTL